MTDADEIARILRSVGDQVWPAEDRVIGKRGDNQHRAIGIDVRRREQPRDMDRQHVWPSSRRVIGHLPPEESP